MSELYVVVKWLHIVSSTVLFGMGAGIAFFFIRAHRTQDPRVIAAVASDVVMADTIFTASAVVLQPTTGLVMVLMAGFPIKSPWLVLSMVLYALVGCCWLPVVGYQMRMRDLAREAVRNGSPIPSAYHDYYRRWFVLGWPAFLGVLVIFYLMVAKPKLW